VITGIAEYVMIRKNRLSCSTIQWNWSLVAPPAKFAFVKILLDNIKGRHPYPSGNLLKSLADTFFFKYMSKPSAAF
jgi:hypothetical protein